METPLTILYTAHLRGDLEVLPRLYNFLRQLRAHYSEEVVQVCADDPAVAPGSVLLLDLGASCDPSVWHCDVTSGRSMLVVLDGMGFNAARVENAAGLYEKLGENVRLALVDAASPQMIEDVLLAAEDYAGESETRPYSLQITLSPSDATRLDGRRLSLASVEGGQVGSVTLAQIVGRWVLTGQEIHDLPRRILPDPTIAATVEFVLSEARYAQKRRKSTSD